VYPPGEEGSDEERADVEKENNPGGASGNEAAAAADEIDDNKQAPLGEKAARENAGKPASTNKGGGGKGRGKGATGAKKSAAAATGGAVEQDEIVGKTKTGSRKAKVRVRRLAF